MHVSYVGPPTILFPHCGPPQLEEEFLAPLVLTTLQQQQGGVGLKFSTFKVKRVIMLSSLK